MKIFGYIATFILGTVCAFYVLYNNIEEPIPITIYDTLWLDTLYLEKEPIISENIKPKKSVDTITIHDTITLRDTVIVTDVAELDTILNEGALNVKYYIAPEYFSLMWKPNPEKVVERIIHKETTVTTPCTMKWHEKPSVAFFGGILITALIVGAVR